MSERWSERWSEKWSDELTKKQIIVQIWSWVKSWVINQGLRLYLNIAGKSGNIRHNRNIRLYDNMFIIDWVNYWIIHQENENYFVLCTVIGWKIRKHDSEKMWRGDCIFCRVFLSLLNYRVFIFLRERLRINKRIEIGKIVCDFRVYNSIIQEEGRE